MFCTRTWVLRFLAQLRCALHNLALCRVCAMALGFVSGQRACSSVSLCKFIANPVCFNWWSRSRRCRCFQRSPANPSSLLVTLYCPTSRRVPPAGLRCAVSPSPRLRLFRPVSRPVCGFWFGFALRRVALLCGVFVQLRLALFPAGGPFLLSLSVNLYCPTPLVVGHHTQQLCSNVDFDAQDAQAEHAR
jgi:hypothetical protein